MFDEGSQGEVLFVGRGHKQKKKKSLGTTDLKYTDDDQHCPQRFCYGS